MSDTGKGIDYKPEYAVDVSSAQAYSAAGFISSAMHLDNKAVAKVHYTDDGLYNMKLHLYLENHTNKIVFTQIAVYDPASGPLLFIFSIAAVPGGKALECIDLNQSFARSPSRITVKTRYATGD